MRALVRIVTLFVSIVSVPAIAAAQGTLTGTVRDTSGAVLPGATVEASSEALIEKTRSAITDDTGQFRIVDLRPGTYSLTFTLEGFNAVRRDGIELSGDATLTVSAELRVGSIQETVSVTAESPIVDVQSVRRQVTVSNEVISSLPAARSYAGVMMLIPATTIQAGGNLDIQVTPGMLVFGGMGGRNNEARIQVDGMNTGAAFNGAGVSSYIPDIGNAQEVVMTTSGGMGEAEVGGPSFSIVPKTGGNRFSGSIYQSNVTGGMVGDNYTDDLRQRGLQTPGQLQKLWDFNIGLGGPIKKDKVWFFFQFRDEGSHRTVPGMFANKNMGDPTKWIYEADESRPAVTAGSWRNAALRLTVQPTPRNQFRVFWDQQMPCQGAGFLGTDEGCRQSGDNEIICGAPGASNPPCTATTAPEIGTYLSGYGQRVQQAMWSSPVSSRLFLEAGFSTYLSQWGGTAHPGSNFEQLVGVTEQCSPACSHGIGNLQYRSGTYRQNFQGTLSWKGSASYVSGAHNMKFGYQGGHLIDDQVTHTNDQYISYRINNGVPNQITQNINNFDQQQRVRYMAFYGQESWTLGRFTLQGALRYDRAWSYFPEVTVGPVRFLPEAITFPKTEGVTGYNDISPRGGLAWDVFGNSKTSVRLNVGKYLQAAQNGTAGTVTYGQLRPTQRLATTVTRAWTDTDRDFVPDCDLSNPSPNNGGDQCGVISDTAFGTTRPTSTLDDQLVSGWGVRAGDWQIGASITQQIFPRVSVEIGYQRRWLNNFVATNNQAVDFGNFTEFSIVAPNDPRLPEEARGRTISGLYNVNDDKIGQVDDNVTLASDFGDYKQTSNGILFNVTARLRSGLTFQGGISTGATRTDYCGVRGVVPEQNNVVGTTFNYFSFYPTNPWCNYSTGWVTRYTGLGSYIVPKLDVQVSGTFRSDQGGILQALLTVPSAQAAQTLGRPLSGGVQNVTVNLIEPGTLYGDRVNEIDLRFAKLLRFGGTKTNVGFDLYNVLNTAPVLTYSQVFNNAWLRPQSVLQPRFWKFSVQFDF